MKRLITSLIIFASLQVQAKSTDLWSKENLAIKGGVGFYHGDLRQDESRAKRVGASFNPHVSYRLYPFELIISGLIATGKEKSFRFNVNQQSLGGELRSHEVAISPMIRFYTPFSIKRERWPIYISFGPSWSLHSFNFKQNSEARDKGFDVSGDRFKLAYDTTGFIAAIGIQEFTKYKEMNPFFIEVIWISNRSRKMSVLDTEKFYKTNTVYTESNDTLKQSLFILNMGVTFF